MKRRNRSQYDVRAYLGPELYERVLREAVARRISLSECIREDVREFYALRDELAAALRVEGDERPPGQRIMHTLLEQTEVRIAAGIGAQAEALSRLTQRLRRLESMIDRHYLGMMLHLPEVAENLWDERSSSASGRHRAWKREVEEQIKAAEEAPKVRDATSDTRLPTAARRQSGAAD